ncbi:MAG: PAS domain S-box protein [Candidatus Nanopelagicales bacterium]|nr:PAS domain S-box protein [Candidatus Nanopelagicales bacterium]
MSGASDSADRLRATLDSLLDPHVVLTAVRDDQGRIIDFEFTEANAAACRYNGLEYDELMGTRLLDLLPGHETAGLMDRYRRVIETGEPLVLDDFVYRVEVQSGAERHFDIRGVAVGDDIVYTWRDVTDREAMVEELRTAESNYRALADATTDMAYRTDETGVITWVSPSAERVLGWTAAELLGRTILDVSVDGHDESTRSERDAIYAGGAEPVRNPPGVYRLRHRSGAIVSMSATVARDVDHHGQPTGGLLVGLKDVTALLAEQEAAEQERRKAERLQVSIDSAAIGMAITSPQGVFESVNPALAAMVGYRQDQMAGMSFQDITHPEDRDASAALLHRLTGGESDHVSMRKRYITATGQTLWVDLAVGVARNERGDIDHFIAQIIDVSAEVDYADALERTVRRFRLLAENASDVVYEVAHDFRILWVSPSVQNVLGWRPESLIGQSLLDLLEEDTAPASLSRLVEGFSLDSEPLLYRTATGTSRWMSALARPITDADGGFSGAIVGLRDISAEVVAEDAVAQLQTRLRLAVDAAPAGLAITDADDVLVDVNHEFCRLLGRREQELTGHNILVVLRAASSDPCTPDLRHEHQISTDTGSRWVSHAVSRVPADDDGAEYQVHLLSDVTGSRRLRDELAHLASHDGLTGVANRRQVLDRFAAMAAGSGTSMGVVFCDVDGLKAINDTYGHAAGDAVLTAVASRLAATIRSHDDVGRIGGDEFVVLLDRISTHADLAAVAEKLRRHVSGPVEVHGRRIPVSASFGAALVNPDDDARTALDRADDSLYRAKAAGRDAVMVAD